MTRGTRAARRRRVAARAWPLVRAPLLLLFGSLTAAIMAMLVAVFAFPYDASRLEQGGPLILTDRHGEVLRTAPNPASGGAGRHGRMTWVALSEVPAAVVQAVIQSEDEHFFDHRGVDGRGVARALWLNLRARRLAYGGSTITMQLARMVHSPDRPRTLWNKLRETVLALRIERAVDKRTILEQYLNRAYYGNGAYGIEAAARRYLGKPAAALSTGEATFLAVLPRAPTAYDPIRHPGRALVRRDYVLSMLVERDLLAPDEARRAREQSISIALHEPPFVAPHFTEWVLSELPDDVRARGGVVTTTIDLALQRALERRVADHVAGLRERNLGEAGAVVLDTGTGEVLAMVGSPRFDADAGEINIATWRRHPGSALKPFVYAAAIERGDTPASIAYDIRGVTPGYTVVNPTQPERGPVRYREALAGSYNLAAIDVLDRVGIARVMSLLREAGVTPLAELPDDYGLRLALGAAKVRLLDLAAGYGFLVRDGRVRAPTGVIEVALDAGSGSRASRVVGGATRWAPPAVRDRRIVSPETSFLVMDMLADPEARRAAFGQELPLDLPFPVAAKTGTSRGFADTVTVAVTREVTVAAWAGNFDGTPTQGLVAMESAAPLARAALLVYADGWAGGALTLPDAPAGLEQHEVCALSGLPASPACPHRKLEWTRAGENNARHDAAETGETCDWHKHAAGGVAIEYPPEARQWAARRRDRGGRRL